MIPSESATDVALGALCRSLADRAQRVFRCRRVRRRRGAPDPGRDDASSRLSRCALQQLLDDPAGAIGTIQVCITMTNLLLGWIGEPAMSAVLHRAVGPLKTWSPAVFEAVSLSLSFIVVTLLTVVFSELLPKELTLRYTVPAARLTAVPVQFVRRLVRPLVWLMNALANAVTVPLGLGRVDEPEKQTVTADELRLLASQAAEDGVLTPRERTVILKALGLAARSVRQIMVPRMKVVYLDLRWSMRENRRVLNDFLHSRLPLCNGGLDHVVGLVHVKEFFAAYYEAGDVSVLQLIAHPPVFVPANATVERLLEQLHRHQTQFMFVVDEYGGVEGIVTLQDVVNELLGPLPEPARSR
jgi:putative hemolysin